MFVISSEKSCPDGSEDFLYDFWPGSRMHCNYQHDEDERKIVFDETCGGGGIDVAALAPVFQNRFRGLKYCGKRSHSSYLDFQRPVPVLGQSLQSNE